jgi:hypothetical protein
MGNAFIVHHSPNNRRYEYDGDPNNAVDSARALLVARELNWVAGNCWRMMRSGDLVLFKFGGSQLMQPAGIYAGGRVVREPARRGRGRWVFRCAIDVGLTRQLMRDPIIGRDLKRVVTRSFGASIQPVGPAGQRALLRLVGRCAGLAPDTRISRGLLVLKEPLDMILSGIKTWEIRGSRTAHRGRIALIESKSGTVVGTCEVVDAVGPLSLAELRRNARHSGYHPSALPYRRTYAWVLRNARRLSKAVPYHHPSGAVIWVRLEPSVVRRFGPDA